MIIPFYGLVLFLIFVYFEPSLFFPLLAEARVAFIISVLTIVAAMIAGARPPKALQNRLFILLLIIAVVASVFSPIPFNDNTKLHLSHLYKAIALYFLVCMLVSSKDYLVKFYYITMGFGSFVGIASFLTVRQGIAALKGGHLYRMVNYFGGIGADPNEFGAFMLAMLPLPFVLIEGEKSLPKRILLLFITLIFILCVIRTRSRGAFVGLMVILAMIFWENRKKAGRVLLLAVFVLFAFFHTHHGYWERISTIESTESIEADNSAYSRILQMGYALKMMRLYPLTGVGPGNFVQAKISLFGLNPELKGTFLVPHNAYLGLGAEIGVFGILIFISIIIISILNSYSSQKFFEKKEKLFIFYRFSKGIRIGLIGLAISIFFLSQQYNLILYQWIGFTVALNAIAGREASFDAKSGNIAKSENLLPEK